MHTWRTGHLAASTSLDKLGCFWRVAARGRRLARPSPSRFAGDHGPPTYANPATGLTSVSASSTSARDLHLANRRLHLQRRPFHRARPLASILASSRNGRISRRRRSRSSSAHEPPVPPAPPGCSRPSIAPRRRTIDVRRLSHLGTPNRLCNLCDIRPHCDWEIYWHPLVSQPSQHLVADRNV